MFSETAAARQSYKFHNEAYVRLSQGRVWVTRKTARGKEHTLHVEDVYFFFLIFFNKK